MRYDDPKAEQFGRDVAEAADEYYKQVLSGPTNTMVDALNNMWVFTGDRKYAAEATKVKDVMTNLPLVAADRASKGYTAAMDPNAEPAELESVLDPSAVAVVDHAWEVAAQLSDSDLNDARARAAKGIVRTMAQQLSPLLDKFGAQAYDDAVLNPAADKYLQ